jgi:hypothetical protein
MMDNLYAYEKITQLKIYETERLSEHFHQVHEALEQKRAEKDKVKKDKPQPTHRRHLFTHN